MAIRILHTGDLHIGMTYSRYPEAVQKLLSEARVEVLKTLVARANEENCNLFIIAGDLFDRLRVNKSLVTKVMAILAGFGGEALLLLPGNHDYDDGTNELWRYISGNMPDNMVLLNEDKVYSLTSHNLDVDVYPAYCHRKHSATNKLAWMKENQECDPQKINIGVAHGAVEGLSPDMQGEYFYMTVKELENIPVDVWLLGHAHVRYPDLEEVAGAAVFNCGTPEPDGLNFSRKGNAWLIDINEDKKISAQSLHPGIYQFYNLNCRVESEADFEKILRDVIDENAGRKVVRLCLHGNIDEELMKRRNEYYQQLEENLLYFQVDDTKLGKKITKELIDQEFTVNSFPYRLLRRLADDGEALQLAYELIGRAK